MPHRQSWNTRKPEARSFCQSCRVGAVPRHLSHRLLPSQTHLQGPDWKWSKQVSTGIGVNPPVSQHQPGFFFFLNLKVKSYRKWEVNDKQRGLPSGWAALNPFLPYKLILQVPIGKAGVSVCVSSSNITYLMLSVFLWKYLLAGAFFFFNYGLLWCPILSKAPP